MTSLTSGLPSRSRGVNTRCSPDVTLKLTPVEKPPSRESWQAPPSRASPSDAAIQRDLVTLFMCNAPPCGLQSVRRLGSAARGCPDTDVRIGATATRRQDHRFGQLDDHGEGVEAGQEIDPRVAERGRFGLRTDLGQGPGDWRPVRDDAEELLEIDEERVIAQPGEHLDTGRRAEYAVDPAAHHGRH